MGFTNAATIGLIGFSSSVKLKYTKDVRITINPDDKRLLVPESNENRRIEIISDKEIELYYEGQINPLDKCYPDGVWLDWNCNDNLYVMSRDESANITVLVRSDKPIYYEIGDNLMIPVKLRLCVGTGTNFVERNVSDFDSDSTQYLINLYKLKNSDSGVTGWKLFDIFTFYPGKTITFAVSLVNAANYGAVAVQLFDPISVGESLFDLANDVVNLELNNLGGSFIGNLTRDAWYKDVVENSVAVSPDFSRHIGRFVAKNTVTGKYDTAIIKSYTPNSDIYKGGVFELTGEF